MSQAYRVYVHFESLLQLVSVPGEGAEGFSTLVLFIFVL